MPASDLFRRFERLLNPSEEQEDIAFARAANCCSALRNYYSPGAELSNVMTLLGSLAKKTACPPLGDVDLLFRMPAGTYSRYQSYSGNGQSALLQDVRSVLHARYPRTDIRGDGPVVVVGFESGPNVEVVPGVLVDEGADILNASCLVPVTKGGGWWEASDYGADYQALWNADYRLSGQVRRLIRYMKAWRQVQNVTFKSLVIELMAIDFSRDWPIERSGYEFDDWLVRDFLRYAVDHYFYAYPLPKTGKRIDTGVGWWNAAQASAETAQFACGLDENGTSYIRSWKEILGNGFGA